jgi:glycosyltransferase involved in cell wall biosynthesis
MRLTILSVAYPFAPASEDAVGGAEQVLACVDQALAERRHIHLAVAAEGSRLRGTVLPHPMPARIDDAARATAHARYRRTLAQVLDALRVDVIHDHDLGFAEHAPPPGAPLLVTLHLPPSFYSRAAFELPRAGTTFVCVSRTQRDSLPATRAAVRLIPNGVRLDAFAPSMRPIGERGYALVLARVCPEKGVHLAVEAARRADMGLAVAGSVFPYLSHERYFNDEIAPRLDRRRRFLGPVGLAEKRALLAGARCVLVPSLAPETSSLVAMEALASGTPVVAFRAGALPEIVEHGRTGFLVGDVGEMAAAIARVGELSGAVCRAAAEGRFDARAMCDAYLSLYEELTVARARAGAREDGRA